MLSPSVPFASTVSAVLLVALLIVLAVRAIRKDRREYGRFKRYRSTKRRQALYRKWLIESFALFGGASLLVMLVAWQFVPLLIVDVDALPATIELRNFIDDGGDLLAGIVIGVLAALVVGGIAALFAARKSQDVPAIGDIAALLPRNREELRYGALLSVNAGIVEELLFRLAIPALLYAATGNAIVAVVGSVVLFALLHLYQGVWGVIGSLVIGAVLMFLYLATGNILVPIVVHIAIDLRSLVLIPVIVFRVHKNEPAHPRSAASATKE